MSSQWLKVTAPNGEPVWLRPDQCSRVRRRDSNVAEEAQSIIDGSFGVQAAVETVEMVMKAMNKC